MQDMNLKAIDELDSFISASKGLAIMEFTGDGCGFCAEQAKAIEKLEFLDQRIKGFKINTDASPVHAEIAENFNIDVLPSIVFVRDGEIIDVNDPGTPATPCAFVCSLPYASLKKLATFIIAKEGNIFDYFFSKSCRSCRKFKNGTCIFHRVKPMPDDLCNQYKRGIKYAL